MNCQQDYVCSIMIYKEAFDHEYDTPKDWELKEINNVMNNSIFGWEKISSHRFAEYGIQRGWRRIVDKEEFHKLPEHAETPFEKISFSPCLQFLFTPVYAEAVNTMVYEKI